MTNWYFYIIEWELSKINFPNLPFLNQEMISVFLTCEKSSWVLIAFFVSTVSVRIWELWVTCLLDMSVMAYCEISSCSKCRAKVDRVENCTFFIYQCHFLLERNWKKERVSSDIRMQCISSWFPRHRSESPNNFPKLSLNKNKSIWFSITKLMKLLDWKIMLTSSIQQMNTSDIFMLKQLSKKQTLIFPINQFTIIKFQWFFDKTNINISQPTFLKLLSHNRFPQSLLWCPLLSITSSRFIKIRKRNFLLKIIQTHSIPILTKKDILHLIINIILLEVKMLYKFLKTIVVFSRNEVK